MVGVLEGVDHFELGERGLWHANDISHSNTERAHGTLVLNSTLIEANFTDHVVATSEDCEQLRRLFAEANSAAKIVCLKVEISHRDVSRVDRRRAALFCILKVLKILG